MDKPAIELPTVVLCAYEGCDGQVHLEVGAFKGECEECGRETRLMFSPGPSGTDYYVIKGVREYDIGSMAGRMNRGTSAGLSRFSQHVDMRCRAKFLGLSEDPEMAAIRRVSEEIAGMAMETLMGYGVSVGLTEPELSSWAADRFIELLDKEFFNEVKKLKNTSITVTADHATPCKLKTHSGDPVPLVIYGKGNDKVEKFSEKECKKGSLGTIQGKDLMKKLHL